MFVRAIHGQYIFLGIGKQIDHGDEGFHIVEYFDSPGKEPVQFQIRAQDLESVELPKETRIYYYNTPLESWEIGRVEEDTKTQQLCSFPNRVIRWLDTDDVYVRWARPVADPTLLLIEKLNETPHFSDRRRGFVRSIMEQRAATMGMSGLLSSAVQLEAHQIEVVRRILQDPVQRYLLADEVGLGKTIEAGILIRQCMLDCQYKASILVIVPKGLVAQWRTELDRKFFLGGNLDQGIHVVALNDADAIRQHLGRLDMLVIDEAHHLTGRRPGLDAGLYRDVADAARGIERVLLLSATPALHNERGFLEMLHILDPDTYLLDDEAGFHQRVNDRQMLAGIVADLAPENAYFLHDTLDQLAEHFAADHLLQQHVEALRAIMDVSMEESNPELVEAIGRVHAHVSEVYRLHRRILRHRRRSITGLTPNRSGVTTISYNSAGTANLCESLETWRLEEIISTQDEAIINDRMRMYFPTVERIEQYACSGAGAVGFLARQVHLVGDSNRFNAIVRNLENEAHFNDRAQALVDALHPLVGDRQQFVIFCTDPKTADRLVTVLHTELGVTVDRHKPDDAAWTAFRDDRSRSILVCDRAAEEGLNLEGGSKVVVHYDLPFNPNRIEQRLGRVDRYGAGDAVHSMVLLCTDNPYEMAWARYLDSALHVFDRSIASLQYAIENTARTFMSALYHEGPEAIDDLIRKNAGKDGLIEREIKAIDQQDALDALGVPPSDRLDMIWDVDDSCDTPCSAWIEEALQFDRIDTQGPGRVHPGMSRPFAYGYKTKNRHTLLPLQAFFDYCDSAITRTPSDEARRAKIIETYPLTYSRRTAVSTMGRLQHARLLRLGEPFIDGIWAQTRLDERGRSTAMWRLFPGHVSENVADLYFCFNFIVQPDLSQASAVLARANRLTVASRAAISRRGDMAMPPIFYSVWVDQERQPVTDASTLSKLDLAYEKTQTKQGKADYNLNPKRWNNLSCLNLPQLLDWPGMCRTARQTAELLLRSSPEFTQGLEAADKQAAETDRGRLGQLRARLDRRNNPVDELEWQIEHDLSVALRVGITAPMVTVDAVTACFLTGNPQATMELDNNA